MYKRLSRYVAFYFSKESEQNYVLEFTLKNNKIFDLSLPLFILYS